MCTVKTRPTLVKDPRCLSRLVSTTSVLYLATSKCETTLVYNEFFLLSPPQEAPEGILDRCQYVRIDGSNKVDLTDQVKEHILNLVKQYGTGGCGFYSIFFCLFSDFTILY